MKAAHRARAKIIKSRDLAMDTARSVRNHLALVGRESHPNELELIRCCIKAARDCQHYALRFARRGARS